MSKNAFTAVKDFVQQPKRNTFDLSFQNNLTMQFGRLYPVFCKEVIPGDSFRIKPTFGLRFMPLVFPIQTRMQANLHFFYVRNRNLWKDWPDFIGRTKSNLVPPFLSPEVAKKVCKTGALGDYFGLPTTIVGDYGSQVNTNYENGLNPYNDLNNRYLTEYVVDEGGNVSTLEYGSTLGQAQRLYSQAIDAHYSPRSGGIMSPVAELREFNGLDVSYIDSGSTNTVVGAALELRVFLIDRSLGEENYKYVLRGALADNLGTVTTEAYDEHTYKHTLHIPASNVASLKLYKEDGSYISWNDIASTFATQIGPGQPLVRVLVSSFTSGIVGPGYDVQAEIFNLSPGESYMYVGTPNYYKGVDAFELKMRALTNEDVTDLGDVANPYATGDLKISALPFRAYESIYNAFYRNQFNDPFILNGQKEFNKFITNDEGGADTHLYDFFNRNWEMDFLTSAKQSPVDGDITPLVGVTGTGQFTFQNQDGTTYVVTPTFGEDGHTLTGIDTIEGTPENNTGIRRLMDLASVGISINDFRNVNALQRWLETNLRRGYRYKDQLMSHFGVDAKYDVLDMPEFIGGMSEPVLVNQISQSVDQTDDPTGQGSFSKVLGSYAGQASVLAQSSHDISKYCDEHGFIIGILSITPVPNYSQLLPKMFLKDNVLDYYFPEFGHIGNQPIPYREVCPLQSFATGDSLNDVFGYNRAWYDYLAAVDEVHGDFRTSLEGFLINRVFNSRPELGRDFVQVDNEYISNPFSVTDDGDKILGQVYFEVTAQRPIPKYGIPRLE